MQGSANGTVCTLCIVGHDLTLKPESLTQEVSRLNIVGVKGYAVKGHIKTYARARTRRMLCA